MALWLLALLTAAKRSYNVNYVMGRIFRRGELREVVLVTVANIGPTHGYGVVAELRRAIDGWNPSPGAVYPALLSLSDQGLLTTDEKGGEVLYEPTADGHLRAAELRPNVRWAALTTLASEQKPPHSVGDFLDQFASQYPGRAITLTGEQAEGVRRILADSNRKIDQLLAKEVAPTKERKHANNSNL